MQEYNAEEEYLLMLPQGHVQQQRLVTERVGGPYAVHFWLY